MRRYYTTTGAIRLRRAERKAFIEEVGARKNRRRRLLHSERNFQKVATQDLRKEKGGLGVVGVYVDKDVRNESLRKAIASEGVNE